MCEVTRSNFKDIYPQIKEDFSKCTFISIDCEFSSLFSNDEIQNSLFDTPSVRYTKMRNCAKNSIPLQIGLTAFYYLRDENIYLAKPYIFYTIPAYFSLVDKSFICTSSSFAFLCEYNFDFNKFAYQGIPYLNLNQESQLVQDIKNSTLFTNIKYEMRNKLKNEFQEIASNVSKWFYGEKQNKKEKNKKNNNENEMILFETNKYSTDFIFCVHNELRNRFLSENLGVWTFIEDNKFKVKKISRTEYNTLSSKSSLENELLDNYLGFTKVYRLLRDLKKPIIGHNLLLDIMMIINNFENDLPSKYLQFKKSLKNIFPTIYDTKFISFELREKLDRDMKWDSNGLEDLYNYFRNEKGRHLVKSSPRIEIDENFKVKSEKFHDAGWDSFCTGYCFIRMAHFYAASNYSDTSRAIVSSEHFNAVEKFKNCVNVIRAVVPHLKLDGPDPVSRRPPCLIIKSKKKDAIDIYKVTELLSNYGSVEIKPYADKGRIAIAACANYGSARRILGHFKNHNELRISQYNVVKHSPVFRAALWSGVVISSAALVFLFRLKFVSV